MTNDDFAKRQISAPPHREDFFSRGEFIYDPDDPWPLPRSGMIVHREDKWLITLAPRSISEEWFTAPLVDHKGQIGRHILIDHSGLGIQRGPAIDPSPWMAIRSATLAMLRDADKRRLLLDDLRKSLSETIGLDSDLVDDTLRMMASMGCAKATSASCGIWYGLSSSVHDSFVRKDYLGTFSDELLAKSQRIDFLIRHTGTVGSYREALLRGTLHQILPARYHASTGFIENCARQLDIIVWDAANYAPLFREQDVVVVPPASVRGVIEVKTTLDTGALDDALDILHEILRVEPLPVPVFKGIFAFHQGYKTDAGIAERMRCFYRGDGIVTREHKYLFQGVTAVCVPRYNFVIERPEIDTEKPDAFPKPCLYGLFSNWPGDTKTPAFLSELMAHLDLDPLPKRTLTEMFGPIFRELEQVKLLQLFNDEWQPTLARTDFDKVLTAQGARSYVERVAAFRAGMLTARKSRKVWERKSRNQRLAPHPLHRHLNERDCVTCAFANPTHRVTSCAKIKTYAQKLEP